MMEASEHAYLLADHSKFEKKGLIQLTELSKINTIFSDSDLSETFQVYCEKNDVLTVL
ncbi:Bacterial regulatory proteins, deoR family [Rodentibacter pneumotropicus]|uniref:Bacterial regulatory proteins, deoR family n=2 Tax=Rodentibacter pneumotropicus TaxID=758 RepID=A0A448MLA5_9PAST|nr:Bacterial regulatory proteins, deoR family [Rodentibacter pneumotropicus]